MFFKDLVLARQGDGEMAQENLVLFANGVGSYTGLDGSILTSENHSFSNDIVSQTIENGSALTDHIIIQPDELELSIFASNVDGINLPLDGETAKTILATLKSIRDNRTLVSIMTQHQLYKSMAIESISATHDAPWKGRLIIVCKLKKVDITNTVNQTPASKLEPFSVSGLGAFNDSSQPDYWGELTKTIANGKWKPSDVSYSGMQTVDDGTIQTTKQTTAQDSFWDSLLNLFLSGTSTLTSGLSEYQNAQTALKGDLLYSIVQAVGAQTFSVVLGNATLQCYAYFCSLSGVWLCDISDSQGSPLLTGGLLSPGCNPAKGLSFIDSNGDIIFSGVRMLSRIDGAENTPYAFTPDASGNSACIIAFTTAAGETAFQELEALANSPKPLNFDISEMDYILS